MYVKRGTTKKKRVMDKRELLMEEAVAVMKTISNEPAPVFQNDSVEHFGNFVIARLREMQSVDRKHCEEEIMKVLFKY